MVLLETPRLILRGWRLEDVDDFFEYAKDPEIGPNAGWPPHENKNISLKILKNFIEKQEIWAIVYKNNRKVIGSLGVHRDEKRDDPNVRMIGYVLSREYWGRGLMPEATDKVLQYLFTFKKLDLVSCYHYPFNLRSKRVIEKSGFKFEGILRNASRLYNGQVYDNYCYSITREEYMEKSLKK